MSQCRDEAVPPAFSSGAVPLIDVLIVMHVLLLQALLWKPTG